MQAIYVILSTYQPGKAAPQTKSAPVLMHDRAVG